MEREYVGQMVQFPNDHFLHKCISDLKHKSVHHYVSVTQDGGIPEIVIAYCLYPCVCVCVRLCMCVCVFQALIVVVILGWIFVPIYIKAEVNTTNISDT